MLLLNCEVKLVEGRVLDWMWKGVEEGEGKSGRNENKKSGKREENVEENEWLGKIYMN